MFITILRRINEVPNGSKSKMYLTWNDWNDYNFKTMFNAFYIDEKSQIQDLSFIRIAFYGQTELETKLKIGDSFDSISEEYFSLGSEKYYEKLNKLSSTVRDKILKSLNDLAKYPAIYEKAIRERVTTISLLRGITFTEVTGQLRRMANGGVRLTPFNFRFHTSVNANTSLKILLIFNVIPQSNPPTNINVLIGRNGSGKTTIINNILKTLLTNDKQSDFGELHIGDHFSENKIFPNLISISFSAFDENIFYTPDNIIDKTIKYTYIGLKR